MSRGYRAPHKTIVENNVAALVWANDINDGADVVIKVELLVVDGETGIAEPFFDFGESWDVHRCLSGATAHMETINLSLRSSW